MPPPSSLRYYDKVLFSLSRSFMFQLGMFIVGLDTVLPMLDLFVKNDISCVLLQSFFQGSIVYKATTEKETQINNNKNNNNNTS